MRIPTTSHEAAILILCNIRPVNWDRVDGKLMLLFEADEKFLRAKSIIKNPRIDICVPVKSYNRLKRWIDNIQDYNSDYRSFTSFCDCMLERMPIVDLEKTSIGLPCNDIDGNLINRPGYNLEEEGGDEQ